MYELNSRVRYSETDIDAKLSLTGIMNYMQDCSTMQSEDAGVGISYLGQEKKAWLLSSWQIVIERRPVLGERIRVVTWPYAVKGLYALRNFAILDENGGYLVKANSYWFLMNTETGRPMRIMESDTAPYGEFSPKIEMEDAGRKIAVLGDMGELGTEEKELHYMVGEHFAGKGIDALYCAGELSAKIAEAVVTVSKYTEVHYYKEKEQLLENLMKEVKIGDTILVKASHFMGFSEIVKELIQ